MVLPAAPYSELLAESLIASWFSWAAGIAGAELPLREVRFLHPAPEDTVPFARFSDAYDKQIRSTSPT